MKSNRHPGYTDGRGDLNDHPTLFGLIEEGGDDGNERAREDHSAIGTECVPEKGAFEPLEPRPSAGALSPVAVTIAAVRRYLHLENVEHILVALATAVSAMAEGEPLWAMIVGPPSSSKTEAVRLVEAVADARLAEVTKAGLLSAQAGKPHKQVGVLTKIGAKGFLTIGDFSACLASSDRGGRDELYALLRSVYDGNVVRHLGNLPDPLRWEGRLTLLAACTSAIDNFTSHAGELGPRWLYLRVPDLTPSGERAAQQRVRDHQDDLWALRADAQRVARECVAHARGHACSVDLAPLAEALDAAALTLALGRASVPRHGYGRREIIGEGEVEGTARIAGQLAHLARGLLALGLPEEYAGALCARAALDSMPLARRRVLGTLAGGELLNASQIARVAGSDRGVVTRALEDLGIVGACEHDGRDEEGQRGRARLWRLAGERTTDIAATYQLAPKCRYPLSISPQNEEEPISPQFGTSPEVAE